jgi:citrate lyase subunit beta/citryl-CoA lyase
MTAMLQRSYLFVPANRPDRFDKALASGADVVIVDLEDAVPPEGKDAARADVDAWLTGSKPVVLRINSTDTPWFQKDLELCRRAGVAAVMLPKAESPSDIAALGLDLRVIPLIESAVGLDNVRSIAAAPGVHRLAFGAIDFQLDLSMRATYADLLFFRSQIVLASRLASLDGPIDSPSIVIDDLDVVGNESDSARRLGFGAKLCIHPKQVDIVNRAFSTTAAEREWARRVVEIAAASGCAAVALDGKMIDRPVIRRAEAILRECSPP